MRLSAYLLACIGLIQSSLSYADLSLLQATQQAFLLDPELQALNRLQSVDPVRLQQAGRLPNPTLAVEFDNLGAPSAIDGDGTSVELRYSQDVSLNNKRELRVTLAQAEQLNTQLAIQKRSAALSAEVRLCLARWTMADARLAWQKDEQSIAQAQARVLSERLRAGKIVPSEYQRAQALAQETTAQALGQQQMVDVARAECALLVGTLSLQPIPLPTHLPDLGQQVALSQQQADVDVTTAHARMVLATAERQPDVTVSVGARRSQNQRQPVWLLGASVPLTFFDQNQVRKPLHKASLMQQDITLRWLLSVPHCVYNRYAHNMWLHSSSWRCCNNKFCLPAQRAYGLQKWPIRRVKPAY
jgi:cobalt-zinc-cadmium efflux system outer membrane protein